MARRALRVKLRAHSAGLTETTRTLHHTYSTRVAVARREKPDSVVPNALSASSPPPRRNDVDALGGDRPPDLQLALSRIPGRARYVVALKESSAVRTRHCADFHHKLQQ